MTSSVPCPLVAFSADAALACFGEHALVASPFQSRDWLAAWLTAHGTLEDFRVIEVRKDEGRWLLPLQMSQRAGLRILQKVGGAHASFFTPARLGSPPPLTPTDLQASVQALGAHALILEDCPLSWEKHPLFSGVFPSAPDLARGLTLEPETLRQLDKGEAAKKLRAKKRKLEALGQLEAGFEDCRTAPAVLEHLLTWKEAQLRSLGIRNLFADQHIGAFLRHGLEPCGGLRLFSLRLEGHPIAALLVAQAASHASGMITAFDPRPDIARCGPGDVLVRDLILALAQEGMAGFDLGVGDARYKRMHAPEEIPLLDVHAAVSAAGAAFVTLHKTARRAKAAIKREGSLFEKLKSARSKVFGTRSGA